MRFSFTSALVALLAADSVLASSWFTKAAYNKWHETELERWLSDHNVPYPTPADRKDLENLISQNWQDKVVTPYNSWDLNQLQKYVSARGDEVQKGAAQSKDSLIQQVQQTWVDTEDKSNEAYTNVRDWIFDSWSESQLKSFADKQGIPVPQPRTRDSLLKTVRENYQKAADTLGQSYYYPGNWIYESWSDSDLKAWLDERGIPAPQPTSRDKLIASVRRNSRVASNNISAWSSYAAASAAAATQRVSDAVFDTWSDSQLKKFADEQGIKVPQGSKRNELLAVIRRNNAKAQNAASSAASSVASAYGAATSSAGNEYARATDDAYSNFNSFQKVVGEYIDWAKTQIGLAASTASYSGASASKSASKAAQKATDRAKQEL